MSRNERKAASGRLVVQKFAAHLAHLLNAEGELNMGELYRKILRTLSGERRHGKDNNPYADKLVAVYVLGAGVSAQEGASAYFELVLNRPLFLAGRRHHHKGHEVHLALCRRGIDDRWKSAEIVRAKEPNSIPEFGELPSDFTSVHDRICECCARYRGQISSGNPAVSTRAEFGPLYLRLVAGATELPEELSVWEAVRCAPSKTRVLTGEEFDEFCSLVIKAVETANAYYGALVRLGLSPRDWHDVTVNTAKKASAFVSEVRAVAEKSGAGAKDIEIWQDVWNKRAVPGFKSAREFWDSELGCQIRFSWADGKQVVPELSYVVESDESDAKMDRAGLPELLRICLHERVLDGYDVWLLSHLNGGKKLKKLARSPKTVFKFGKPEISESYIDELRERIRTYLSEKNHPDKGI